MQQVCAHFNTCRMLYTFRSSVDSKRSFVYEYECFVTEMSILLFWRSLSNGLVDIAIFHRRVRPNFRRGRYDNDRARDVIMPKRNTAMKNLKNEFTVLFFPRVLKHCSFCELNLLSYTYLHAYFVYFVFVNPAIVRVRSRSILRRRQRTSTNN